MPPQILRLRAQFGENGQLNWTFDNEEMSDTVAKVDVPEDITVADGDVWHVQLLDSTKDRRLKKTVARVELIARDFSVPDWLKITHLEGHWIEKELLQAILINLHTNKNVLLIGDKGVGKTTLCYKLAGSLGAAITKVDVGTFKHGNDLFGSDAAVDKESKFIRSNFSRFVDRAMIAHQAGLPTMFIVILDEVNRVHQKNNQTLQGLLDWTRQVTITTAEGSTVIKLPPNIKIIATMNQGAKFEVFRMDPSLIERFAPIRISQMPFEFEVQMLTHDATFGGIDEKIARQIVHVARNLRAAEHGNQIDFAPSYRFCQVAAGYRKFGIPLELACQLAFLEIYEGDRTIKDGKIKFDPNSAYGKAHSALHMQGVASEPTHVKKETT